MASSFYCQAYDDVQAKISLSDGVVYLSLNAGKDDLHLTLNPMQANTLGKALKNSGERICIGEAVKHAVLGNLEVKFEVEDKNSVEDEDKKKAFCPDLTAERPVA